MNIDLIYFATITVVRARIVDENEAALCDGRVPARRGAGVGTSRAQCDLRPRRPSRVPVAARLGPEFVAILATDEVRSPTSRSRRSGGQVLKRAGRYGASGSASTPSRISIAASCATRGDNVTPLCMTVMYTSRRD